MASPQGDGANPAGNGSQLGLKPLNGETKMTTLVERGIITERTHTALVVVARAFPGMDEQIFSFIGLCEEDRDYSENEIVCALAAIANGANTERLLKVAIETLSEARNLARANGETMAVYVPRLPLQAPCYKKATTEFGNKPERLFWMVRASGMIQWKGEWL